MTDRPEESSPPTTDLDRRQFLGRAALGLVAATLTPALAQSLAPTEKPSTPPEERSPLPEDQRVGYAIIGLGAISLGQMMPAIRESKRSRITALVSGDPAKARKVAQQYGVDPSSIYTYDTFDQIRDNPAVQAVYIALPNSMHREYTERAARAGKHVLTEKPMTVSPEDAQAMIDACARAGVKLMVAYRAHFEPRHVEAARLTQAHAFGRPKIIQGEFVQNMGDPEQWRLKRALAGGGALPDIGLYPLNFASYVLNEQPSSVVANIYSTPGDPRFREVEESVGFSLRFPSGVLAQISTSYGAHRSGRFRVMSERGWTDLNPAFQYEGNQLSVGRRVGQQEGTEQRTVENKNQFTLEVDHFSQAVREHTPLKTPGEMGLQDHRIMAAIYRSAQEGRSIPLDG
ncbi:Gfo/Idh/MocA family oxidoreductase [Deinococcus sonorensis]|uniref:Gfo/Idh/MocA family oxidoreductase n=2 Tax=Deinococcus sonorensis TaxID=309891 RepID=A0AAU7U5W0_9DEIO